MIKGGWVGSVSGSLPRPQLVGAEGDRRHTSTTRTRKISMLMAKTLTNEIIGAAIEVHRTLGAGLLESIYEQALCQELSLRSIPHRRQVELPVRYKGIDLEGTLRIDLLVANHVVVELKAVEHQLPIHACQLLTYLRISGYRVGLLINFNVPVLRNGILRRVL